VKRKEGLDNAKTAALEKGKERKWEKKGFGKKKNRQVRKHECQKKKVRGHSKKKKKMWWSGGAWKRSLRGGRSRQKDPTKNVKKGSWETEGLPGKFQPGGRGTKNRGGKEKAIHWGQEEILTRDQFL